MVQSASGSLAAGNDAPGPGQYDVSLAMEDRGQWIPEVWCNEADGFSR